MIIVEDDCVSAWPCIRMNPDAADIENLQMLGISCGDSLQDAWKRLLGENEWIKDGGYEEAVGYRLADEGEKGWVGVSQ